MIPIYIPYPCSFRRAKEALESGWISSQGQYIKQAEQIFRDYMELSHFILMNNGTTATHALMLTLKHFHTEVKTIYVPNNVYTAVWNCVLMEYGPKQMEVLPIGPDLNMTLSDEELMALKPNSAMIIVHNVGNIVDIERIATIRPDIVLVEDMCEALFGKYANGQFIGSSNKVLCSSISFFANKIITSGEGGALVTQHDHVASFIRRIINQGNSAERYKHDIHGYNYRPTNIQAAILLDQFEHLETILVKKEQLFEKYRQLLADEPAISFPQSSYGVSANWMMCIRIKGAQDFNKTLAFFNAHGVDIRPFFYPIHYHTHLTEYKKDDALSELLSCECIMIPSYPTLSDEQVALIVDTIKAFIHQ